MYSEQQAKNGFKTFVVTLSISLLLFGALYYLITDFSSEIDIETSAKATETVAYKADVKGTSDYSVFGEISEIPVDAQSGRVLAEHDETTGDAMEAMEEDTEESTESTVPDTGSEQVIGAVLAMTFFSAAAYMLLVGPRKLALSKFEKSTVESFDK